jgi:hypothetical protein
MIITQCDIAPENGAWHRLPVSLFLFFSSYTFFVWTIELAACGFADEGRQFWSRFLLFRDGEFKWQFAMQVI